MAFTIDQVSDPSQLSVDNDIETIFAISDKFFTKDILSTKDIDLFWRDIDSNWDKRDKVSNLPKLVQEGLDAAIQNASNERMIGLRNNMVSVEFLELGLLAKRAVGKLSHPALDACATCAHVGHNIIMTNYHAIPHENLAEHWELQMGFEHQRVGAKKSTQYFDLDPERFFVSNKALDYSLVATKGNGCAGLADTFGTLYPQSDKFICPIGDPAALIHHPRGQEMTLSIHDSIFFELPTNSRIAGHFAAYTGDTMKGSSGAPVFDKNWNFVALHRKGRVKRDAEGRYLKKDGSAFHDRQDFERNELLAWWECNLGTRCSNIVGDLKTRAFRDENTKSIALGLVDLWS